MIIVKFAFSTEEADVSAITWRFSLRPPTEFNMMRLITRFVPKGHWSVQVVLICKILAVLEPGQELVLAQQRRAESAACKTRQTRPAVWAGTLTQFKSADLCYQILIQFLLALWQGDRSAKLGWHIFYPIVKQLMSHNLSEKILIWVRQKQNWNLLTLQI